MKYLFLTFLLFVNLYGAARGVVNSDYYACTLKEYCNDMEVFTKLGDIKNMAQYIKRGKCIQTKKGMTITVINLSNDLMFEFVYDGSKYWTYSKTVTIN